MASRAAFRPVVLHGRAPDLPWHRSRLPCVSLLVFINMTLGPYLPATTLALASCAFLGGCLSSSERHGSTPGRPPAMPTMALPTSSSAEKASESEIIANALRAARSNAFDGVVRTLRAAGDASTRARLADEIVKKISSDDPKLAARLALALGTEFQLIAIVERAGRNLARNDAQFALRWASELPAGTVSRQMSRAIVDELVSANPSMAIEQIQALPEGPVREDLMVLGAGAWGRRDPDAAISWLRGRPDDGLKQRLTSSIGFEVAQTRPNRAIEIAEMLPAGRDRWLLMSAIAQTWVATDSKAALAWAGGLPAGEPRDAALAGIDTGLGMPVSRRIAGAPGTRGGSSRTRGGGAAVAASAYPQINSPSFEAWLATQPKGMSREEAILEYIRQRGALEPGAVGPLISTLPGHIRDQAAQIYLDGLLIGNSPGEAARWVRSLPRSERSDELIEKTARRWLLTNPDAAVEWVEQSTLPQHRKEQLLREAGR
jgi:hypothetical protein